jgi:hypothetical protein
MQDIDAGLRDIAQIRSMMQRATKFLSLSGLSGVCAGALALAGSVLARGMLEEGGENAVIDVAAVAVSVLVLAMTLALLLSRRMARKRGLSFWNAAARHLLLALAVPLGAGGVFSCMLAVHGYYAMIPAAMLVFYGIALVHGAAFTHVEVRYLGALQITLGLFSAAWPDAGLVLWALGFGVLHIVYGIAMWMKYERESDARAA